MARQEEVNEIEKANWHWRNTMRPIRFFSWDARAGMPFLILLVFPRMWTLLLCIAVTIIFQLFEKKGLTFPSAVRAIRLWIVGYDRPGWMLIRRRDFIEHK